MDIEREQKCLILEAQPHDLDVTQSSWLARIWLGQPIATFCWLCTLISLFLIAFSTVQR